MIKEKEKALNEAFERFMDMSFMKIPIDQSASQSIADDVFGWGTTIDEEVHTFSGWNWMIDRQYEQAESMNLDFHFDREPRHRRISKSGDSALIIEVLHVTISGDEFVNKLSFRLSVVLEYVENNTWKVIHWHGSIPSDSEDDTWHVNELKEKTERLEREVQERTAELEAKNYELTIEASVEKVRSRAMGMQTSDDLAQVLETLHEEIQKLDLEGQFASGIMILRDQNTMDVLGIGYDANNKQKVYSETDPVEINRFSQYKNLIEEWRTNQDYFILHLSPADIKLHGEEIRNDEKYASSADVWDQAIRDGKIKELWKVGAGFKEGLLGGDFTKPPNEWVKIVLTKMANAFGMAYQRFLELQLKEEQAQLIKDEKELLAKALHELHATQDQLIQKEKLASLGQLTAGIAHEIKNPLNFVNNFSEVSLEMIDEAIDETRQAGDNPHNLETISILTDIKSNLTKIHEHGSRADGVVKSMLQHSRGGSGVLEPTDLNGLVKEYVNLAFHGMRAGKDPIDVDIDLNLDESIGQVPLIAEDFSRVILNVCNNGFDTLREKGQGISDKGEEFAAKLSVRTKRDGDNVIIEIEDNGVGIPDDIKDKILQPFFTTKKGTQGTGLGLSITHDIIKAHGGKIEVQSTASKTVFSIILNSNSTI